MRWSLQINCIFLRWIFLNYFKINHIKFTRKRPENMTAEDLSQLFRLILHFEGIGTANTTEYKILQNILRVNKLNINTVVDGIRPKCSFAFDRCMWKGAEQRCDSLFQRINTSEGVCCTFNNHASTKTNFPT